MANLSIVMLRTTIVLHTIVCFSKARVFDRFCEIGLSEAFMKLGFQKLGFSIAFVFGLYFLKRLCAFAAARALARAHSRARMRLRAPTSACDRFPRLRPISGALTRLPRPAMSDACGRMRTGARACACSQTRLRACSNTCSRFLTRLLSRLLARLPARLHAHLLSHLLEDLLEHLLARLLALRTY